MYTPDTVAGIAGTLKDAAVAAERERSPALAAAYDEALGSAGAAASAYAALLEAAKALTDALAAQGATIAGCADEIAALSALYPET